MTDQAKKVLFSTIAALEALNPGPALQLLAARLVNIRGKAILTGMGKSGFVARKIAATLQSTGQPACFLDPAGAAHGDMGIIGPDDLLIALSNSGKTNEILAVMEYAVRDRNIPCAAICSDNRSPMGYLATYFLPIPAMPEGCPIGRAPMASTTCQMVVGDMLAAECMVARGFTEADFLKLHHGGYLGQRIAEELA